MFNPSCDEPIFYRIDHPKFSCPHCGSPVYTLEGKCHRCKKIMSTKKHRASGRTIQVLIKIVLPKQGT